MKPRKTEQGSQVKARDLRENHHGIMINTTEGKQGTDETEKEPAKTGVLYHMAGREAPSTTRFLRERTTAHKPAT